LHHSLPFTLGLGSCPNLGMGNVVPVGSLVAEPFLEVLVDGPVAHKALEERVLPLGL